MEIRRLHTSELPDDLLARDASCMANSLQNSLCIGTNKGDVLLLDNIETNVTIRYSLEGREYKSIKGICWVFPTKFACMHIKGIATLWRRYDGEITIQTILDTTTAAIPSCIHMTGTTLLVSDSRGNVTSFNLDQTGDSSKQLFPQSICIKAHRKEHVNAITSRGQHIISVGNDGCLQWYLLQSGELKTGISIPVAGLTGLMNVWMDQRRGQCLVVSGYLGNEYAVVNAENGYDIAHFDTGGRQRQLVQHLMFHETELRCAFAVCVGRKDGRNEILIKTELHLSLKNSDSIFEDYSERVVFHNEPVYDCCMFLTRDDGPTALLTGSEDCSSMVSILGRNGCVWSQRLPPQESCVRAVSASHHPSSSTTLLSVCGGKLTIQFFLFHDITSMDDSSFFVEVKGKGRLPGSASGIDHRINAVVSSPTTNANEHVVFIGDSCGKISLIRVDENARGSVPGGLVATMPRSVLSLSLVELRKDIYLLFVGTTGGELTVWKIAIPEPSKSDELWRIQAHQIGTNCIDTLVLAKSTSVNEILITSCGDDQALTTAIVEVSFDDTEASLCCKTKSSSTIREAGISALKGVVIVDSHHIITAGYGQQIQIWQRREEGDAILQVSEPVDVGDVNTLAATQRHEETLVVVGGEGLEVFAVILESVGS